MKSESTAPFDWVEYRVAIASGSRLLARDAMRRVRQWYQVARERRTLAALDDRALKDIGLSRAEALDEASRPFWDTAPAPIRRVE